MAAIFSGAYVLSSSRVGSADGAAPVFGGKGFAFDPSGATLGETQGEEDAVLIDIERDKADAARD